MEKNKAIPKLLEKLADDTAFIENDEERKSFVEAFKRILIEI